MIAKHFLIPAITLFVFPFSVTFAADDAQAWLLKMSQAISQLNYQGTFVYQHGKQLEAMKIIHRAEGGSVSERLISMNGSPREVIRDNAEVRCYLPDQNSVVVGHRRAESKGFPSILPENLQLLHQNYQIKVGRSGRVTDRDAQLIVILPLDQYRYGYHLWADKKTGLLLEADLINTKGGIIERFMFTDIVIGKPILPQALLPRAKGKEMVWYRQSDKPSSDKVSLPWKATQLPKGFTLSASMKHSSPMRGIPADHLVYSDGLAAVSIFIEEQVQPQKNKMLGPNYMGAVHTYGSQVDNYWITVVGEVPEKTVKLIGRSVKADN